MSGNKLRDELAEKEGSPYHETSEARVLAFKNGWDACLENLSPDTPLQPVKDEGREEKKYYAIIYEDTDPDTGDKRQSNEIARAYTYLMAKVIKDAFSVQDEYENREYLISVAHYFKAPEPSNKEQEGVSMEEYNHAIEEIGQLQEQLKEAEQEIRELQNQINHE